MSGPVSYARQGRVGVITVDNPPVNALSQPVRKGIIDGLDQGLADDGVAAIVLTAAGRTFIAGADITEFNKPLMEPDLNTVVNRLEDSGKPVVVALFGTTLGGGLEVALGCHYRVAVADAACGLPEVKLGIIPGAGGTQRLPRVAGVQAAIDMIPSGRFVPAAEAHAMGLVDAIVDTPVTDAAIAFAEDLIAQGKGARKSRDGTGLSDAAAALAALDAALPTVTKAARGQMSPVQALDAIRLAVTEAEFFDGLKGERRIFEDLRASDQSKALRHMFFAERDAQKVPGIDKSTPTRPIAAAGVIGAGTMGGGIAMAFANAGIPVTVVERDQAALARGLGVVEANYRATAAKGKLTDAQVAERLALITGTTDPGQLAQADIIIEAVFERLDAKQEIFRILDGIAKPGAILASNTSTLDIDRIAGATGRPADVIGTHFFSPANVMRLLELVRGRETAPEVIATAMKLGKAL